MTMKGRPRCARSRCPCGYLKGGARKGVEKLTENGSRVQTIIISQYTCAMPAPVFSEAKSGRRQGENYLYHVSKYSKSKQKCMLSL